MRRDRSGGPCSDRSVFCCLVHYGAMFLPIFFFSSFVSFLLSFLFVFIHAFSLLFNSLSSFFSFSFAVRMFRVGGKRAPGDRARGAGEF